MRGVRIARFIGVLVVMPVMVSPPEAATLDAGRAEKR